MDRIKVMVDRVDTEHLIHLVKSKPNIWDKTWPHKDTMLRNASWHNICRIVNPEYNKMEKKDKCVYAKLLMKRWTNIRDAWKKSLAHKKKMRPYVYYDHLKFLLNNYKPLGNQQTDSVNGDTVNDGVVIEETIGVDEGDVTEVVGEDIMNYEVGFVATEGLSEDDISERSCSTSQPTIEKVVTEEVEYVNLEDKKDNTIQFMESKPKLVASEEESHYISFVKGLLPILNELDEDQSLEFQSGVIKVLQHIKSRSCKIQTVTEEPNTFTYISSDKVNY